MVLDAQSGSLPDDRALWNTLLGLFGCPAVLVARDAGVFGFLATGERTLPELCEATRLPRRPAQAILGLTTAAGLLSFNEGRYGLAPAARAYLLESSPTYFGGFLDMVVMAYGMYSYEGLKRVAQTDAPMVYDGAELFEVHAQKAEMAAMFTRAMHGMSVAPAAAWPTKVSLEGAGALLDVGGGSGVHALSAVEANPGLTATVLDIPAVCAVAQDFIGKKHLATRVSVSPKNMWKDSFPPADVHFYGSVFHDWPLERCELLAKKSFESLPPGGRILVHEMLLDDDKAGPQAVAAFSVSMLFGTEGEQYSGAELTAVLKAAGFVDVQVTRTFGYWGIVSGAKAR